MSVTVKREFKEEAGNLATAEERAHCSVLIDKLFSQPKASLGPSPPPLYHLLPRNLKMVYEGCLTLTLTLSLTLT